MKYSVDYLLKKALANSETPDKTLVQKVKNGARIGNGEFYTKKKYPFHVLSSVAATFLLVATLCASMYLTSLTPKENVDKNAASAASVKYSEILEFAPALAEAFENGRAVILEDSVTEGDYIFTAHAIVHGGKELSKDPDKAGFTSDERSYLLVSVQRTDKNPCDVSFGISLNLYNFSNEFEKRIGSPVSYGSMVNGIQYVVYESDTLKWLIWDSIISIDFTVFVDDESGASIPNFIPDPDYSLIKLDLSTAKLLDNPQNFTELLFNVTGDRKLTAAFESDMATVFDRSISACDQTTGIEYIFTLHSMVSGKYTDLRKEKAFEYNSFWTEEGTYILFSVRRADGKKDDNQLQLWNGLYIKPSKASMPFMFRTSFTPTRGGITYHLVEIDKLILKPNTTLSIGLSISGIESPNFRFTNYMDVSRGVSYSLTMFHEYWAKGTISQNPENLWANVIFEIPAEEILTTPELVELYARENVIVNERPDNSEQYREYVAKGKILPTNKDEWEANDNDQRITRAYFFANLDDIADWVPVKGTVKKLPIRNGFVTYKVDYMDVPIELHANSILNQLTAVKQYRKLDYFNDFYKLIWNEEGNAFVARAVQFSLDAEGRITATVVEATNYKDKLPLQ